VFAFHNHMKGLFLFAYLFQKYAVRNRGIFTIGLLF